MKPFDIEELRRVESLGLNCEVGFLLRALGDETPSLFRWTGTPPAAIVTLLDDDFAGLFDPDNLVPHGEDGLRDFRYDMYFHTNLKTAADGDGWCFVDPDERKRMRVLKAERSIVLAMVERLRRRFLLPDVLYTMTYLDGRLPYASVPVERIVEALKRRCGAVPFTVLEVRTTPDPARFGQVERVSANLLRGYLAHYVPMENDRIDLANWQSLLRRALDATRLRRRWLPRLRWPGRRGR